MKKKAKKALLTVPLAFSLLLTAAPFDSVAKAENNTVPVTEQFLLKQGVDSDKVDSLIDKINSGKKLDADIFLEKNSAQSLVASSESPVIRKDFEDGSFIELKIEDITPSKTPSKRLSRVSPMDVDQVGGLQENRTLKVSQHTAWGYFSFKADIYFPLIGYAKIKRAYDWYYLGTVYSTEYNGVYRAEETATQDAVAIYKLQCEVAGNVGIRYLAKLELRIKDGRYWSTYSS